MLLCAPLTLVRPIFPASCSHLFLSPLAEVERPVAAFGRPGAYEGPDDIGSLQVAVRLMLKAH